MSDDDVPAEPSRPSWSSGRGAVLTVAIVVGISPFATDMYIPAPPVVDPGLVRRTGRCHPGLDVDRRRDPRRPP